MSQLDLAVTADVTPRHISFIETGRAAPSREMLATLADAMEMPLRDRNDLYLAAGFASPYKETGFDDDELIQVRGALDRILSGHEPDPAVVLDRHWNVVRANQGADRLFRSMLDLSTRIDAPNVLELVFDAEGLRPHIENWDELAPELIQRARREAVGGVPDATLQAMIDRLEPLAPPVEGVPTAVPVVDVTFRTPTGTARYFSTVTTLGTPRDVTVQELRVELFHPCS